MNTSPTNRFERRKARTRRLLQETTIRLILEKGYDAVTVQDITDQSDVGRGTFYIHFNDKEDIVWQALREGFDAFYADLLAQTGSLASPLLEYHIWQCTFEYAGEHRDLFLVMMGGRGSALLSERIEQYLVDAVIVMRQGGRCFPDIPLPDPVLAEAVVGALVRLLRWWLGTPNGCSPAQMAGHLFSLFFRQAAPKD